MRSAHIVFLGGGNMASAVVTGLLQDGYPNTSLSIVERNEQKREQLSTHFAVQVVENFSEVADRCDILVLAVKPHQMADALTSIAASVKRDWPLLITLALGWDLADCGSYTQANTPIVRVMPNTPAMLQAGATGMFANDHVSIAQKEQAEKIFRAVGVTVWVEQESHIDIVTALAGSGPAYLFYFFESMCQQAIQMGLDEKSAKLLTMQTAFGAGKMALESGQPLSVLREQVTSKGGATEAALQQFKLHNLEGTVQDAMQAAFVRGEELAKQWRGPKRLSVEEE